VTVKCVAPHSPGCLFGVVAKQMGGPMNALENSSAELQAHCRHLRCKEMYYQGNQEDEYASGAYWCSQTQENFGPDGEPAGKTECCAGRTCYVG